MDMKRNILIAFAILIFQFGHTNSECFILPEVENSSNNSTGPGPYASGTIIKFECDVGFNSTGDSKVYICTGNSWRNGSFRCEKIYCGHIKTPENVIIENDPTYEIGSSISFDCKEGYNVIGQPNAKCEIDGNWLPKEPPKCQIKMCGDFDSIQHAKTFQDSSVGVTNSYGSEVKVICESGYVINGPPVVMCQADGKWSIRPTCKKSACPHYPGLNSSCIKTTQVQGNVLNLTCKNDVPVTKAGPDKIECIDGQWEKTNETMGCYCNCKVIADRTLVFLNNVDKEYINHTHTLDWSCKNGSTKVVTEPLLCNDGNTLYPVCQGSPLPTIEPKFTDKVGITVSPHPIKPPEYNFKGLALVIVYVVLAFFMIVAVYCYGKWSKDNPASTNTQTYNEVLLPDRGAMGDRPTNYSNGHVGDWNISCDHTCI